MAKLTRVDGDVTIPDRLPVIALRDLAFFPYMVLPLLIGRPRSTAALEEAREGEGYLLLLAQQSSETEEPGTRDLHRVGTVVKLLQCSPLPDGTYRVVLEGIGRAFVERFSSSGNGFRARIAPYGEGDRAAGEPDSELQALVRRVRRMYADYVIFNERMPEGLDRTLEGVEDRVRAAHLMAGHFLIPVTEKQALLECDSDRTVYDKLHELLNRELEILQIEEKLDEEIRRQMDSDRRQHYLHEQLRAITKELGDNEPSEWAELEEKIRTAGLPAAALERAEREMSRLQKLNPVAPEAAVIRTYLDWIVHLPWSARTDDNLDVRHASELLDQAHFGLGEVKERILDHIAVLSLVGELQGPILCLVGPPGVGKTSLGRSIAQALNREFVRVSLGGVRDEAEIRGHRRTYVGALPGRVIQGMRRSGSRNPVFLLDEVDKMARDFHGDPGSALLEVLDPEQNRSFTDHYLELDYDLSDVLFLTTANTLADIPEPLRDRMEIIRIPGYLDTEKREIAQSFIWPSLLERHGLNRNSVELPDETVDRIVRRWTREAGVRELQQRLSRVARKMARLTADAAAAEDPEKAVSGATRIQPDDLREILGPPPYPESERESGPDRVGIANGLAWTAAGGEVLDVEVAVVPGSGKIQLTGTLGDVMKESAVAALTYARSRARRLGLDPRFHKEMDIHVHIPEGATPKDGPSAGITMAVALLSALMQRPTLADVAMTGEITLRGRVLPVGGIKEKTVAALRAGMRTVLLPAGNEPEIELLPQEVRDRVELVCVSTMDEVLEAALGAQPDLARDGGAVGALFLDPPDPGAQISQ
jgi:ATP-dependent Lon protease